MFKGLILWDFTFLCWDEPNTNDDVQNTEQAAHEKFKEFLHQKEWFQLHWKQVEEWLIV